MHNCGPYDCGRLLPKLPALHQEVFRAGSHARTAEEAQRVADKLTLVGAAERITCPLLVVVGAEDKLVPPSEGERLAKTASGPTEPGGLSRRQSCLLQHQLQIPSADGGLDGRTPRRRAGLIGYPARNHSDNVIFDRHERVAALMPQAWPAHRERPKAQG